IYTRFARRPAISFLFPSAVMMALHPPQTFLPYTTLFRSLRRVRPPLRPDRGGRGPDAGGAAPRGPLHPDPGAGWPVRGLPRDERSEEHTSELQSRFDAVCRLLLEIKDHGVVLVGCELFGK